MHVFWHILKWEPEPVKNKDLSFGENPTPISENPYSSQSITMKICRYIFFWSKSLSDCFSFISFKFLWTLRFCKNCPDLRKLIQAANIWRDHLWIYLKRAGSRKLNFSNFFGKYEMYSSAYDSILLLSNIEVLT